MSRSAGAGTDENRRRDRDGGSSRPRPSRTTRCCTRRRTLHRGAASACNCRHMVFACASARTLSAAAATATRGRVIGALPCGGVPLVQAVPTIPVAVCVEARLVAVAIADPVRVAVSPASRRPLSAVVAVPKARGGIALRIADAVAELAPFAAARAKQRLALGRRQRRVKVGARTAVHDEREGCRLEPKHREVQGARGGNVAATEELVVAADREDVDAYLEGCALPGQGQRSGQPQGAPSCCARPPAAPLPVGSRPSP